MLYLFAVGSWTKLGFTTQRDPWRRAQDGFWSNAHPTELCGLLGDIELLACFEGDLDLEKTVQFLFPPDHGEFWRDRRQVLLAFLRLVAPELPAPPKPMMAYFAHERQPCCGGRMHKCFQCGVAFGRYHRLQQHVKERRGG